MGNDGGSIPKRRELVQEAARNPTTAELKEKQTEHQEHHWTHDPLTDEPLRPPIVSDHLGRLYNKDAILEYLLPSPDAIPAGKRAEQDAFVRGAVTRLKDVVEVKFKDEASNDNRTTRWVCPITDKQLGAWTRAVYLVPCGHAFAAAAIREVADSQCLQCDTAYAPNDVIPILPVDSEDVARLTLRMQTLREKGLAHSLKKDKSEGKKRKKAAGVEASGVATDITKAQDTIRQSDTEKEALSKTNIKDAATASLTARVLAEQQATAKRRRLDGREHIDSLYTRPTSDGAVKGKNVDFMTRGYAISR